MRDFSQWIECYSFQSLPRFATLNDIIQKKFPEEFAERKLENDTMTNFGVDLMPLFVNHFQMDVSI
ncbi:unnamed protein product [Prunus armeniaca]